MGRLFLLKLEGDIYSCKYCDAHLALCDDVISKIIGLSNGSRVCICATNELILFAQDNKQNRSFICKHGKAYLFDKVVNVTYGEKEDRMMMTGRHTVMDIFCVGCGSIVGWKCESALDKNEQYKEGRFILERFKIAGPDGSLYSINQEAHMLAAQI